MNKKRPYLAIGKNITALKRVHNLTQKTMAEKLNISERLYADLESGIKKPRPEIIKKICEQFNISEQDLSQQESNQFFINEYCKFIGVNYISDLDSKEDKEITEKLKLDIDELKRVLEEKNRIELNYIERINTLEVQIKSLIEQNSILIAQFKN